ncbi:hypothetical protein KI688_002601 [Linnemannia hyalina]|uniref:Translationally-controlled tumor protein homolog n=1 Tax=Linnemannia hyalina TaxID=64524 RepID=A0A9P7XS99_9FUNG|nr:hypothetical protein KI688_002601 [Linnemannia hyalina]
MLIFQDIVTGDQLFSDEFDIKEVGSTYEIECAMILPEDFVVDATNYPSVEDAMEDVKSGVFDVNNVVHYFGLVRLDNISKKEYTDYMRRYFAKLKAKMGITEEADVKALEMEVSSEIMKARDSFDDYFFYTGASCDDGALCASPAAMDPP